MAKIQWQYIFMVVFLFNVSAGHAQRYNKEKLQKQNKELQQQIRKLNKSLNENRSSTKKSILYVKNLESKIKIQQDLIQNTTKQRKVLEDEIYLSQLEINKLKRELGELKKEYKEVLVNAYKNKSLQNKVLFVLASKNFTEAFRRVKYLEKYSGFQGEKADEIKRKQENIRAKISQRESAINEKSNILASQEVLKEKLSQEREEQNQIVADYKKNQNEIVAEIRAHEAESRKLDAQIQKIIEEEIRIAREKEEAERRAREEAARKAREEAARKERERLAKIAEEAKAKGEDPKKAVEVAKAEAPKLKETKPEESYEAMSSNAALSANFTANQGKLPSPVSNGRVIGRFGKQPHPILSGITVNNPGVKIATSRGGEARAVFSGTVTSIQHVSGGTYAVLVQHGNYFTVYNNLSKIYVSKGQTVSTKQPIGQIYTDSDNNTVLDFQVWQNTTKVNPSNWVAGM